MTLDIFPNFWFIYMKFKQCTLNLDTAAFELLKHWQQNLYVPGRKIFLFTGATLKLNLLLQTGTHWQCKILAKNYQMDY